MSNLTRRSPRVHGKPSPIHPEPAPAISADQLAWLNGSPGNTLESYPGPGWDVSDPFADCPSDDHEYSSADAWPFWVDQVQVGAPSEAEQSAYAAERHGVDHDEQFDPNALELWAQTPDDYWGSMAEFEDQQDPYNAMSEAELCEAVGSVAARSHATQG